MPFLLKRRQDTHANWTSADPVIPNKQFALTQDGGGAGICLIKIGDGVSTWSALPYINKRNNLDATTNPAITDDADSFYSIGSIWSNKSDTADPLVYICTDATVGAAVWSQFGGGGGGESFAQTLVIGNTSGGTNVVISDDDVLDLTNIGNVKDMITLPNGGFMRHVASGVIILQSADFEFQNLAGNSTGSINSNGNLDVGSNDVDGSIIIHDASSNFAHTIDTPNITDNRTETLPDGDIDWTGGNEGEVMTQQADGSFSPQASAGSGDMTKAVYDPNTVEADAFAMDNMDKPSTDETGLIDADSISFWDSVASAFANITFTNVKAFLKTYFDTLYLSVSTREEDIDGTAIEDLTITGSENISFDDAAHQVLVLTGNTTITFTDTPSVGLSIVRTYMITSDSTETLGIANSDFEYGEYVADGTENLLSVVASNTSTDGLIIHVMFSQPS